MDWSDFISETFSALASASRRAQKEKERITRSQARAFRISQANESKILNKLTALQNALDEFEEYREIIDRLEGPHRECGERIDWPSILAQSEPVPPQYNEAQEIAARKELENYVPCFLDKTFGHDKRIREELEKNLESAGRIEQEIYQRKYQEYVENFREWSFWCRMAEAILKGDIEAYHYAIERLNPFAELREHGCRFNYTFVDGKRVVVAMTVNGDQAVPTFIKTLTATQKISVKAMSRKRFLELYQDYVCGSVLRVAREFYALLPIQWVNCTAYTELINISTGNKEIMPVLSCNMPRSTVTELNFETIDASDAMRNFVHNMGFKKGLGFHAIQPITSW